MKKVVHAIEKILTRVSEGEEIHPGKIIWANLDYVCMNDLNGFFFLTRFRELGAKRVWNPERIVIVFDHCVPTKDEVTASHQREVREFVRQQGIKNFFDSGRGISHEVLIEEGFVQPGYFMHVGDSHATTHGAITRLRDAYTRKGRDNIVS